MVTEEMRREEATSATETDGSFALSHEDTEDGFAEAAGGEEPIAAGTANSLEGEESDGDGKGNAEAAEVTAGSEAEAVLEPLPEDTAEEESCEEAEARCKALADADYDALCASFPAARAYASLCDIPGAARFSELRELGLSVDEAARAAMPDFGTEYIREPSRDMRFSSMPHRSENTRGGMSYGEMAMARELFSGLSTKELLSLYRRVNQ